MKDPKTAYEALLVIRKLALSPMESNFSMESLSKAGVLTIVMDYLKFTESVKIQQEAAWIANAISYIGIIEDIEFLACYIPDLIKLLNSWVFINCFINGFCPSFIC